MTVFPRTESKASSWPRLTGGECTVATCVQSLPLYSQVSFSKPAEPVPPKRTTRWRLESYVIADQSRDGGRCAVKRGAQAEPSHSHVSCSQPG